MTKSIYRRGILRRMGLLETLCFMYVDANQYWHFEKDNRHLNVKIRKI